MAHMARNQKTLCHPKAFVKAPLIIVDVPIVLPMVMYAMYFPRCERGTISTTSATSGANAPELPMICMRRKAMSAAKLFWRANPMLVIINMSIHMSSIGLLSLRSEKLPVT
ncbi:hypothetical protein N7478_004640 [Penicillium angulare]|uniref:uncharacterized protein n=1 Tax=Penicillium angulare TaxID=116970 RepID=UPI00253F9E7B|nr:uncharacterized protein N7478_004640 [Penicillium angulare]KAJ5279268.1 hypothetical protein N7478_004640 [Penicillium angulare]